MTADIERGPNAALRRNEGTKNRIYGSDFGTGEIVKVVSSYRSGKLFYF